MFFSILFFLDYIKVFFYLPTFVVQQYFHLAIRYDLSKYFIPFHLKFKFTKK